MQPLYQFAAILEMLWKDNGIRSAVSFVSEATYDSTEKDKQKFGDITCRYPPSRAGRKKNNYKIYVQIFDHSAPENILL